MDNVVSTEDFQTLQIKQIAEQLLKLDINVYPGYYNFVHYYPALSRLPKVQKSEDIFPILDREERTIGLYYHIPFCSTSCKFCYYAKRIEADRVEVREYLSYLEKESQMVARYLGRNKIHSIYVGGGSPSYLTNEEIKILMNIIGSNFNISEIKEFTYEVEPNTIDVEKLSTLVDAGVDRLSVGIQSFDNDVLKYYNRAHTGEEAESTASLLRKANPATFNVDFIYGLKGQFLEDIDRSLEFVDSLQPPSVTFYQLWFVTNEKTPVRNWKEKVSPLHQITEMKKKISHGMKDKGYSVDNQCWYVKTHRDRCSHFGFRWKDNPYVGIGQSAYSYINGLAYQNARNYAEYYSLLDQAEIPVKTAKLLSSAEKATRAAILGLKTNDGVCLSHIEVMYNVTLESETDRILDRLLELDLFSQDGERFAFTNEGLFWGDCVLSKLMDEVMFYGN